MIQTSVLAFVLTILAALAPSMAQDVDKSKATDHERRISIMSKLMGEIRMFENVEGTDVELLRSEKPITHYNNNVRRYEDGTLWAFTRNGRPVALMTCNTHDARLRGWWHAVASLSNNRIRAENSGRSVWTPQTRGVNYRPLPSARPLASTSIRRRLQLRKAARRFTAHQLWDPDNQRFELRLLPRPVLVYADESTGVLDGGVFLFTHGVTPELVLVLEAVRGEQTAFLQYAIAKIGSAEFHALLDNEEIYQSPRAPDVVGHSTDPYFLFSTIAPEW